MEQSVYRALLEHARSCLPQEACGLIAGRVCPCPVPAQGDAELGGGTGGTGTDGISPCPVPAQADEREQASCQGAPTRLSRAPAAGDCLKAVEKVYPLTNIDASPEHFSLDPAEHFAAIKDMRARGLVALGNFHSHPSTPARPSAEDLRLAYDPTASYLILSLAAEQPVLRSFHIEQGKATPEPLEIEAPAPQ
jgi:proteasome lid subunit RPN8/RPN11